MTVFDHADRLDLHRRESGQSAAQSGAEQWASITRQGQSLQQPGGEITHQEGADALLAAEILAVTGATPSQRYHALAGEYGGPCYARIDAPADREQKARLARLSADQVSATELAGEPITAKLTTAPGNGAALGGLKVTTANAWFAARPSGTEDVYKIYAESFRGPQHLVEVQQTAREVVDRVIG